MQEVCISDPEALSRLLPAEPCLPENCNCQLDSDCPGENGRYIWKHTNTGLGYLNLLSKRNILLFILITPLISHAVFLFFLGV